MVKQDSETQQPPKIQKKDKRMYAYPENSMRISSTCQEDKIGSENTKKSLGESIRAGFQSLRKKTSSWRRSKAEIPLETSYGGDDDDGSESESEACEVSLFDTQRHRHSLSSSASSTRSHKIRFWLNSVDAERELVDRFTSVQSFTSAKSDTIIYQCPPKHRVRFWLNEKNPYGYSDSILEVRHSEITARIIRARNLADAAAMEASKAANSRRKIRALKFASAVTAAAIARFKEAERDINASHGSIANAAMYAYRAVAAASVIQPQVNGDFKRLQNKFNEHFKHQNEYDYFRRIKNIPMKDLKKDSTEFKMHQRLKAIPTPPMQYDTYKYHSDRLDVIIAKSANRRTNYYAELDASRIEKSQKA